MGKAKPRRGMNKQGALTLRLDKGWEQYNSATDVNNFKRAFARERRKALDSVARAIVEEGVAYGTFEPNALLTTEIKGHSTALLDRKKFLAKTIGTKILSPTSVFVGIRKSHKNYRIAVGLHEGVTIPVTDAMRQMFFSLAAVSAGKMKASSLTGRAKVLYKRKKRGWLPLSAGTKSIKIKGRPFIDSAFQSPKAQSVASDRFSEAVDKTIQALVKGR